MPRPYVPTDNEVQLQFLKIVRDKVTNTPDNLDEAIIIGAQFEAVDAEDFALDDKAKFSKVILDPKIAALLGNGPKDEKSWHQVPGHHAYILDENGDYRFKIKERRIVGTAKEYSLGNLILRDKIIVDGIVFGGGFFLTEQNLISQLSLTPFTFNDSEGNPLPLTGLFQRRLLECQTNALKGVLDRMENRENLVSFENNVIGMTKDFHASLESEIQRLEAVVAYEEAAGIEGPETELVKKELIAKQKEIEAIQKEKERLEQTIQTLKKQESFSNNRVAMITSSIVVGGLTAFMLATFTSILWLQIVVPIASTLLALMLITGMNAGVASTQTKKVLLVSGTLFLFIMSVAAILITFGVITALNLIVLTALTNLVAQIVVPIVMGAIMLNAIYTAFNGYSALSERAVAEQTLQTLTQNLQTLQEESQPLTEYVNSLPPQSIASSAPSTQISVSKEKIHSTDAMVITKTGGAGSEEEKAKFKKEDKEEAVRPESRKLVDQENSLSAPNNGASADDDSEGEPLSPK